MSSRGWNKRTSIVVPIGLYKIYKNHKYLYFGAQLNHISQTVGTFLKGFLVMSRKTFSGSLYFTKVNTAISVYCSCRMTINCMSSSRNSLLIARSPPWLRDPLGCFSVCEGRLSEMEKHKPLLLCHHTILTFGGEKCTIALFLHMPPPISLSTAANTLHSDCVVFMDATSLHS